MCLTSWAQWWLRQQLGDEVELRAVLQDMREIWEGKGERGHGVACDFTVWACLMNGFWGGLGMSKIIGQIVFL